MRRVLLVLALLMISACSKEAPPQTVACPDPVAGCRLDDGISLRFSKTPSVMEKFAVDVQAPKSAEPYASFQMHGMEMGLNRYRLLWNGSQWHADIMLPVCVRGRHDWLMRLEIGGNVYEVPFVSR